MCRIGEDSELFMSLYDPIKQTIIRCDSSCPSLSALSASLIHWSVQTSQVESFATAPFLVNENTFELKFSLAIPRLSEICTHTLSSSCVYVLLLFLSSFTLSPPFLEHAKLEQWHSKNKNTENTNNRAAESNWQWYVVPDGADAKPCHSLSQLVYLCLSHCS